VRDENGRPVLKPKPVTPKILEALIKDFLARSELGGDMLRYVQTHDLLRVEQDLSLGVDSWVKISILPDESGLTYAEMRDGSKVLVALERRGD
jgi:hypothetical protein